MNKKDCEHIGYVFSKLVSGEITSNEMIAEIGDLDVRIREEFEGFGDCRDRDKSVEARYKQLMTNELGGNWPIMKKAREITKRVLAQAESDIPAI